MDGRVTPWPDEVADRGRNAGDDGIVAGREAGTDAMRCPACGYDNLIGADVCDNCGADIWGRDIPEQAPSFHGRLLGEHLHDLDAPPPITVPPDAPLDEVIGRMHETGADCVLVVQDEKLVGIFTDRDAVIRVAGMRLDAAKVGDGLTSGLARADTAPHPVGDVAVEVVADLVVELSLHRGAGKQGPDEAEHESIL